MKKSLTKLLIIAVICGIATFILCYYCSSINYSLDENEVGIRNIGSVLTDVAVPTILSLVIIILQLSARILCMSSKSEEKSKLGKSLKLTEISNVIQVILCFFLIMNSSSGTLGTTLEDTTTIDVPGMNLRSNMVFAVIINVISAILFRLEILKIEKSL